MKTKCLILLLVMFNITLSSCQDANDYTRLDASEIDQGKVEIARKFSDRFHAAQIKGEAYKLTAAEATQPMIDLLTPEMQKNVYSQIKSGFGDYESVVLEEVLITDKAPDIYAIRFKGTFSNSVKKLEVRVALDSNNKVAGFWLKPWMDVMM